MANELAVAESVGRTRHKTEWLRRELHESGRETVVMEVNGKNLAVWELDEDFCCPVGGDPLPYLRAGTGGPVRVDAAWYALFGTEKEIREACDGVLARLTGLAE